jgi:hypothetical protein
MDTGKSRKTFLASQSKISSIQTACWGSQRTSNNPSTWARFSFPDNISVQMPAKSGSQIELSYGSPNVLIIKNIARSVVWTRYLGHHPSRYYGLSQVITVACNVGECSPWNIKCWQSVKKCAEGGTLIDVWWRVECGGQMVVTTFNTY